MDGNQCFIVKNAVKNIPPLFRVVLGRKPKYDLHWIKKYFSYQLTHKELGQTLGQNLDTLIGPNKFQTLMRNTHKVGST